jgi:hypothetical protein
MKGVLRVLRKEVVKASEVGLKPGRWPKGFEYDGSWFVRKDVVFGTKGDVISLTYLAAYTMRLLKVKNG